jgi:Protein of unknown function with HXXEE motif
MTRGERGLWLLVLAGVLHVVEERLLNWRDWAQGISGLPLEWGRFYVINAGFLAIAVAAAVVGWKRPCLSLALPSLVLINGLLFHLAPTVVMGRVSPGIITSVTLYLPLGVWVYWRAAREGVLTQRVALCSVLLGAGVMCIPFAIFSALR